MEFAWPLYVYDVYNGKNVNNNVGQRLAQSFNVVGGNSTMQKLLISTIAGAAIAALSAPAFAKCDPGELVIKFSHVTNTDKHPKGIAATLLAKRVNSEMNGKACMSVYPNSTLYDDNKVLEAMLQGDVHLAAPSLSKFEKFTKKFRLFD